MKNFRTVFIAITLFASNFITKAQTSYHEIPNHFYEDTAVTSIMTMTYDNSGNTFYAAAGEYQFDDGVNFITSTGIRIWKRSTTGVKTGNILYKYSTSSSGETAVKMLYTGSALYVLVQGVYDFAPNDRDVVLLKYNSSMVLQWTRFYNGVGDPNDDAVDMTVGPSGSILVLVKSLNNMITLRYNAAGTLLNTGVYDSGVTNDDDPAKILYANNATYVVGTRPASTGRQTVLVKYNNTLVQQWALLTKMSTGATNDFVKDMTIDTSGNVYVAGDHFNTAYRPFVYKVTPAGTRPWSRKVTYNNMSPMKIFTDNNAQPFFYGDGAPDRYIRLDKNTGVISFNVSLFNGPDQTFSVTDVAKGSTNDIYLIGNYDTLIVDPFYGLLGYYGYRVVKLNTSGGRVWTKDQITSDGHFTVDAGKIYARSNSKIYYDSYESWVGWAGTGYSEFYSVIHAVSPASGIREEEEMSSTETSSLNIFPNPASSIIHFNFNNATNEDAVVSIYNLSGQLLKENKIQANEGFNSNEMNIEELSGGLYILRVTTQAKIMESKVMMTD